MLVENSVGGKKERKASRGRKKVMMVNDIKSGKMYERMKRRAKDGDE